MRNFLLILHLMFFFMPVYASENTLPLNIADDDKIAALYARLNAASNDTAKVNTMLLLCRFYLDSKPDSFFVYARKAYNLSKSLNFNLAKSANALSIAYSLYDDYLNQRKYLIEAYNESLKSPEIEDMFNILNNLGNNYLMTNDYEKALEYAIKADEFTFNFGSRFLSFLNLGQIYIVLGDYSNALSYLLEALSMATTENSNTHITMAYNVLGELYFQKKDFEKSLVYKKKAFEADARDYNYQKINSLHGQAMVYKATGRYDLALKTAMEALTMADADEELLEKMEISYLLAELYKLTSKPELALQYFQQYTELKERIDEINQSRQLNFLHLEFETSQKEQKITALQKETLLRRRLNHFYVLCGGMIIVVLFFIIYNVRQKNKILTLEKKKEMLEKISLEHENKQKDREILVNILYINQQKKTLAGIQTGITEIIENKQKTDVLPKLENLNQEINFKIKLSDDWEQIKLHFEKVHPDFFAQLKNDYPDLTINELKICAYSKLKISIKDISRLLNINPASVQVSRYRLKKKMNLPEEVNFDEYIAAR